MTIEYVGIGHGVELDNGALIIGVVGIPGGDTKTDNAPKGSIALSDNGKFYVKDTTGAGTVRWSSGGSTDISWREPALVKTDTIYANLAAAETAVNTGTIDGVTVAENDRILFTAITGQAKNVFIIVGTPGAGATLVEDSNAPTINDVIRIDDGTDADKVFYFDGASWVDPDAAILSELLNIRNYIGKPSAGPILPDYTSTRTVADNDSLTAAISKLDNVTNVVTNTTLAAATPTTVASVLVDDIQYAVWEVSAINPANGNVEFFTIKAGHDGRTTADATNVKHIEASKFKLSPVAGISFDVTLTGAGAAQTMNLLLTTTNITKASVSMSGYTKANF